eukprot:6188268-Pleurochrysis_carterae.AAC.2
MPGDNAYKESTFSVPYIIFVVIKVRKRGDISGAYLYQTTGLKIGSKCESASAGVRFTGHWPEGRNGRAQALPPLRRRRRPRGHAAVTPHRAGDAHGTGRAPALLRLRLKQGAGERSE